MGSSLSRQEELFLHHEWDELLQEAMTADVEAAAAAATSALCTNADTPAHTGDTESALPAESAGGMQKTKTRKKKAEFQLSFQEWQALLSVLDQKKATSGPSDIATRLSETQLHVPAVALVVHLCSWFRGAISTTVLGERVDALVKQVEETQERRTRSVTAAADGEKDNDTHGADTEKGTTSSVSRRARLAGFVKAKVVDRARGHTASPAPSASAEEELMMLDAFADMACLVHQLLAQADAQAHREDTPTQKNASDVVELYSQTIANPDALRQRPVMAVVMVLVLAVYAVKADGQSSLAARSIAQLEALAAMLTKSTAPRDSSAHKREAPAALMARWPVVGELEAALAHRQHEADVQRCLSSDGEDLLRTLRQLRESREQQGDPSAVASTAAERWAAGASQYVGQRPIWSQLRSHFLSAGVFEADKPTVLVFFGPSGYGKSELAKRVASVLHGCPVSELEASGKMVYIHMPSFCTKDSIYSLVDPPAAHVGSGILLSALQKHPDAVVVLDEFEKSTAESINNLWLSAFQKNGVLRSLKEASRSVSTVRTTFVLTCNTAADAIAARESLYLSASPADQEKIRGLFVTQCKDVCRQTMGDPFVNRVDYFFPFMPYTLAERRQYVCLLLERLLSSQTRKGRDLMVTPGFVNAMVERLHTFHAATLEEVVRSQVMRMVEAGWSSAVLTVERRVGGSAVVLLPAAQTSALSSPSMAPREAPTPSESSGHGAASLWEEAWASLPGGEEAMARWSAALAPNSIEKECKADAAPPLQSEEKTTLEEEEVPARHTSESPAPPPTQLPNPGEDTRELEKVYEREYVVDTAKVTQLELELEQARELVKQRDLEIVTLKEKVFLLQKVLAVVVLALLSCLCVLALVIGLKLTLLFAVSMVYAVVFVLGVPLTLLLEAVQALFRVLGPFKGGVLALVIVVWMTKASKSLAGCA